MKFFLIAVPYACLFLHIRGSRLNKNPELEKKLLNPKVYQKYNRPVKDPATKTNVTLCLGISHIEEVNEVQQTISLHGTLHLMWTDEYLKWNPADFDQNSHINLFSYSVWKPDIGLLNGGKNSPWNINRWRFPVHVTSTGRVFVAQTFNFVVTCTFDFTKYPYDTQKCPIILGEWFYSMKDLTLSIQDHEICEQKFVSLAWDTSMDQDGDGNVQESKKFHVAGWEILNSTTEHQAYDNYAQKIVEDPTKIELWQYERYMTVLKFWITLARHNPYFGVTDVLPMVITAMISLLCFWIDSHGVCLGLLLTNVLLQSIFGWEMLKTMPKGNGNIPKIAHLYALNFCLTGIVFLIHVIFQQVILHFKNEPIPEFANNLFERFRTTKIFEQEGLNFDPQVYIEERRRKSEAKLVKETTEVENQEDAGTAIEDLIEKIDYQNYDDLIYFIRRCLFFVTFFIYVIAIFANIL